MFTLTLHADGYRAGTHHRPHQHDELHLSIVLSGHVEETVGAVTERASALSVVAKDAGVVHANDFGTGARLARLTLPGGTLGALVDDASRTDGWLWRHDPAVARPYLRLVQRSHGSECTFAADDPDILDLLAALTAKPAATHGEPPRWLSQLMWELRSERRPHRSVGGIARTVGVHPVYLARCVRRWYRVSLSDELRRVRMKYASAAIGQTGQTVSHVAHAYGYSDEPHLCREFERRVGLTPGRYRRLVRGLNYTWRGGE